MNAGVSKPISKGDDGAKDLIITALDGNPTGGFDLDSIYFLDGRYIVIEFLKCETVSPSKSHPKYYWFRNAQKFISLWEITLKLEGTLYLVNYEDGYKEFKIIKVLELNDKGITKEEIKHWNFTEFRDWFQSLNSRVLAEDK